ncbi:isochorismate synthase [Kutzneria sp. CA-103260]|uniref:isochorismate synthase n=1 Tax=Kutzneria sp. CA-103260 TaxID=2802641 RepID=UPI001BEE2DED|nr:isochorismate synthase [Kutzneria sp. CA-103260]QUQ70530.1 Isochorismate synthase MenF [Kutzneria sp. CA-103260]
MTAPNARATGLQARSRVVATDEDLLRLLPSAEGALAWVMRGEGLVGWGEAARFEPSGADRFEQADRWWREYSAGIDCVDEVGLPGSGPVAFVSMAFADDPGSSVLVVPRVLVGRRDGITWVTEIGEPAEVHQVEPVRKPTTIAYSEGELPVTEYRDAVAQAVKRMRAGELAKVVLAHDLIASTDEDVDPRFLLHGLASKYPSCWVFSVDGLVGATPEMLMRRQDSRVYSRVLAGTMWPHAGVDADELAQELLASAKNQGEHTYAVESLAEELRPFCSAMSVSPRPHVLRLPNVMHLASDVAGELAGESSLLRLAGAVHPTAAVGGTPRAKAVATITELEGMDRGRYAGPVGWVDANGDGEVGIALRCAEVSGSTVRLFAGGGLVPDSDPDTEVAEAAAKMIPIRDALERAD